MEGTGRSTKLVELFRTNDPVLLSYAGSLLKDRGIPHLVLDQYASVMEGSIGILPRRMMVPADRKIEARRLLNDAGLSKELAGDGKAS